MKKNCRFNRSFVRKSKTYTLSFKGLEKTEADFICHIFKTLISSGIVQLYQNGITTPYYELRCHVPLYSGRNGVFVVPNNVLSNLVSVFGNPNFPSRDVIVDRYGFPLSHIENY